MSALSKIILITVNIDRLLDRTNRKLDYGKPLLWLAENVAAAGHHLEMDSPYSHYFPTCHPSAIMDSATLVGDALSQCNDD
jgi:hypothetical protein